MILVTNVKFVAETIASLTRLNADIMAVILVDLIYSDKVGESSSENDTYLLYLSPTIRTSFLE